MYLNEVPEWGQLSHRFCGSGAVGPHNHDLCWLFEDLSYEASHTRTSSALYSYNRHQEILMAKETDSWGRGCVQAGINIPLTTAAVRLSGTLSLFLD